MLRVCDLLILGDGSQTKLKENNYYIGILQLYLLSDDEDFFDVTLACDYGRVQAHKTMWGLCSPLFQHVLHKNLLGVMKKTALM